MSAFTTVMTCERRGPTRNNKKSEVTWPTRSRRQTGTTNDQVDAWFNGYQKNLVASVWVGFDQPKALDARNWRTSGTTDLDQFMSTRSKTLQRMRRRYRQALSQRASIRKLVPRRSVTDQRHAWFFYWKIRQRTAPEAIIPQRTAKIQTPQQLF